MELKYIILNINGKDVPFVFDKSLTHKWVANDMRHAAMRSLDDNRDPDRDVEIVSAGFTYISADHTWYAIGKSESLNLDSRPEDSKILTKFLTLGQ